MFNIGKCNICKQGLLEIVKDENSGKIYICCDECEAEWDCPKDALSKKNGTRNKYGRIIYPTQEEVLEQRWEVNFYEHNN